MLLTFLDLLGHSLVLAEQRVLPLLKLTDYLLILLLALLLHLPPKPLVLALYRTGAFAGCGIWLDVVVDECVLLVVEDVVLVLENDLHRGEYVERIVDASLHVLELDSVAQLFI